MRFPNNRAYHVIYDDSLADAVKYASENNWTSIVPDIGVPAFSPERITSDERAYLRGMSRNLSIGWGFHAAGDNVSLFSTYPPIRAGIIQYFKQTINLAREISTGPRKRLPRQPPRKNRTSCTSWPTTLGMAMGIA